MNPTSPLQDAYDKYHRQVEALKSLSQWENEDVLQLLRLRDCVQQHIDYLAQQPNQPYISPHVWLNLSEDDKQLGQWQNRLLDTPSLTDWRKSLNPPTHYWWWHLIKEDKPLMLGWLWTGLTLAAIPIILALAKDISTRFLTDVPGFWGSLGLVLPAALGLFAAGGVLTKLGSQVLETLFSTNPEAKRFFPLIQFGLATGLLLGLLAFHIWGLPWAATLSYQTGRQQYFDQGKLAQAQGNFQRALKLKPDFPVAQHNLALTYEDLRDFDKAKAEYSKAVSAGHVESFNNLARLHILVDNDSETAVVLLLTALKAENRERTDKNLEYTLRKNLGWAYLRQRRYLEAQASLNQAIALEGQLSRTWPDAHCLLAQTLEAQKQNATAERELCRRYIELPEDDIWASYLNQALPEEETSDAAKTP